MFGLETLDVMIGLVTVYLALGVACTAIVDGAARWATKRQKLLQETIESLLRGALAEGKEFADAFYAHPLISGLEGAAGKYSKPSFVAPDAFSRVVTLLLCRDTSPEQAIQSMPGAPDGNSAKAMLSVLWQEADGNVDRFKTAIEQHFSAAVARASSRYKAWAETVALIAAFALVIGTNADTVAIAKSLSADPQARALVVERAIALVEANRGAPENKSDAEEQLRAQLSEAREIVGGTGVQVGWTTVPASLGEWISKIFGLTVSAFAVSLGAPFWFRLLQRFMEARTALAGGARAPSSEGRDQKD